MKKINLEEYKTYLVTVYNYECDNNKINIEKRKDLLDSKYKNEYLESIINGTYSFVDKIMIMYMNNELEYIKIPLKEEPDISYIYLNLTGGWMSDTVVRDSENNFYSIGLLKKIFGDFFYIEPNKIEITEEWDGDDDFCTLTEIPSSYLYIQCKKEIINDVKKKLVRTTET